MTKSQHVLFYLGQRVGLEHLGSTPEKVNLRFGMQKTADGNVKSGKEKKEA